MVKIYTKTGDGGETGLVDGTRVPKDALRVAAYGDVDELNAVVGLVRAEDLPPADDALLHEIQRALFARAPSWPTPRRGCATRPPQIFTIQIVLK